MDYTYAYLLGTLPYLLIWLVLFLRRGDCRKEMLLISILFGLAAVITAPLHLATWWRPLTISGTDIGIEDFLFGFATSGIAAVAYEELFRKRLRRSAKRTIAQGGVFYLASFALLFYFLTHVLMLNAFYAVLISYTIGLASLFWYRRDLIYSSFMSGLILLVLSTILYWLIFIPYPEVIERFWLLSGAWYHTLVLGIPIEEYIFFFLTGAFIGPLYEFVTDRRYVSL